ncbi:flagellar assembly protein FliH [Colwellia psychrerythraea]|uniref:Flagellar assembly protein FliH n=1 Tax=Colwellia psychrerythraea TaxID=28229 RepID=A0A099L564_COLPS|nr:flagellar assembly protein FliH [Colwellia psychrerythraea]KGJ97023.1 Flagellar assembly protein FliH/Type III secretion system HrpE [Colwellia psychrerythraea]
MSKVPIRIIKASSEGATDVWDLPNVQGQLSQQDKNKTNAFGKKSNWVYEPPEPQEAEPQPLTAQEIEDIRLAASEEGFNQGKEEGFTKGYEEGKTKGLEEGKLQGIEKGTEQGLTEGKEQIDQQSANWENLITQLHQPLASVEKNVEEQLLNLVLQLTEAVVLHEAKTNPDILMTAITTGIKSLPSNDAQTQICLNPSDIKLVEAQFGGEHIAQQGWRLLPAPQLPQGSCQIENSTSNIDLQMKARLKQVLEPFLQEALHQSS